MNKKIDLTGQRFGRLVVIRDSGKKKKRDTLWVCQCDCGNKKEVRGYLLRNGNTRSCGCFQKDRARENALRDVTGEVFGRLTVVEQNNGRKKDKKTYKCVCSCGKHVIVTQSDLVTKNTKSCGCLFLEGNKEGTKVHAISEKRKINKNNTSGHKGVYWIKKRKKWQAAIGFNKKLIILGHYENKQDAINARKEAEEKYFKPVLDKYNYGKEAKNG